jgi:hypothetical protein
MSLKLNTASGGSITLQEADTASNLTITVPAVSGTMATSTTPSFTTTIGVGGATPAASGAGITFPSTASASSDANTLDDYEEGTFTPSITFGGGNTGLTYSSRNGRYTKIGNVVAFQVGIDIDSKGSSTGSMKVTGLPFSSPAVSYGDYTCAVNLADFTGLTGAVMAKVDEGSSICSLVQSTSTGVAAVTAANAASGFFMFSGIYRVA